MKNHAVHRLIPAVRPLAFVLAIGLAVVQAATTLIGSLARPAGMPDPTTVPVSHSGMGHAAMASTRAATISATTANFNLVHTTTLNNPNYQS